MTTKITDTYIKGSTTGDTQKIMLFLLERKAAGVTEMFTNDIATEVGLANNNTSSMLNQLRKRKLVRSNKTPGVLQHTWSLRATAGTPKKKRKGVVRGAYKKKAVQLDMFAKVDKESAAQAEYEAGGKKVNVYPLAIASNKILVEMVVDLMVNEYVSSKQALQLINDRWKI